MNYSGEKICKNDCEHSNNCTLSTVTDLTTVTAPNFRIFSGQQHLTCFTYKMKGVVMDTIIEKKVQDFMNTQSMFTSVNVANAIKTDGAWVRNREVAEWLRNNFSNLNSQHNSDYMFVQISVGNGQQANLYLPVTADPNNYTDTNLEALTPDDFKKLHGFDPLSATIQTPPATVVLPQPVTQTATSVPLSVTNPLPTKTGVNVKLYKITEFKSGRARIPTELVKKLHLQPHNTVNLKKFDIDQAEAPEHLRVHADGRISLPRKCIKVDNTTVTKNALHAWLDNNIVKFMLA
jgi:hypothetical protein